MRRFALLLGFALSLSATSAIAQNCDGFTDVPASSPFCPDVIWLAEYGITNGCAPSQFCPNEDVTRLQMAAFMHRLGDKTVLQGGNLIGAPLLFGTSDNEDRPSVQGR
jgi:S-layer homology domain